MRKNSTRVIAILTICFSAISVCFAQKQNGARIPVADLYKISADAGGVNLVEGGVTSVRAGGKSGLLIKGETVGVGDRILTSANGRTEILLNPGSYLRLAGNSEFEFTNSSLDDLQIKLTRGSAIMEVITNRDDGFIVGVETPQAKASIIESGVYRFDVLADGASQIEVWKGKLQIGVGKEGIIKGGKTVSVKNSQFAISKFDRGNKDAFEIWSKARAKELTAANATLDRRSMQTSLMSGLYGRTWNAYDTYGVWVFNYRTRTWCFMPFGYGFNSPYGFGFDRNIWDCGLSYQIVYSNPSTGTTTSGSPSNAKQGVTRTDGTPIGREREPSTDRIPRTTPVVEVFNPGRGDSRSDSPIYSPPTRIETTKSEPTIVVPPAPSTDRKPNN